MPEMPDFGPLADRVRQAAPAAGLDAALVERALAAHDYFAVAEALIPHRPELPAEAVQAVLAPLEDALRLKAYTHPAHFGDVPPITFGTSGHRGEIGRGLTLAHIRAIVTAVIEQAEGLSPDEREEAYGSANLDEVKSRGIVIGHDNRLCNPEFSGYAAALLQQAGYTVRYAGRVSTPELSRVVPHLGWAGAINFTPSHNPFRYGGIKTNPCDGGLAAAEFTAPMEQAANRRLQALDPSDWPEPAALQRQIDAAMTAMERVDVHGPYLDCLAAHPVIRFDELCRELRQRPAGQEVCWAADPVWGAAVPIYGRIQERVGAEVLTVLHTEDDYYFGGQTTEPNPHTLQDALDVLKANPAPFQVAIRNDPDGDRGLVGDGRGAIKTNQFAALVMRYLLDIGEAGDVVTTLPTSHFGPDFARLRGHAVHLTPTGFKFFRPYLRTGETMLAYEESDGLSIAGHSLDKDGVLTGLLAVRIVLHYGKPLHTLLDEIEAELGHYHWLQTTFAISISAREAKERLKRLGDHRPGEALEADGHTYRLAELNGEDGYKFIFDDGSWVMMRPSGTEPKVRVYAETRESPEATQRLAALGERLALQAIGE